MIINVGYDKQIDISHMSARTLLLNPKNALPEVTRNSYHILDDITFYGDIISLNFHDNYKIGLGDSIKLKGKNIHYIVNHIESEIDGNYYLTEEFLNKSTYFIVPVVLEGIYKNYLFNTCYFNSYIGTKDNKNYLYVTYKFIDVKGYKATETFLTSQKYFVKVIENNQVFSTFVFTIPVEYDELLHNFWNGDYHLLEGKIKERIKKFYLEPEGLVKKIHFEVNKALTIDLKHKKNLEDSLGCKLPLNMNLISKPSVKDETINLNI